jgi:hypothetical protein
MFQLISFFCYLFFLFNHFLIEIVFLWCCANLIFEKNIMIHLYFFVIFCVQDLKIKNVYFQKIFLICVVLHNIVFTFILFNQFIMCVYF